jgi:hypothetical protein
MALLREVLGAYCGYMPFQNYAGNRSQYVGQREKGKVSLLRVRAGRVPGQEFLAG